jgi:hypothetical protein
MYWRWSVVEDTADRPSAQYRKHRPVFRVVRTELQVGRMLPGDSHLKEMADAVLRTYCYTPDYAPHSDLNAHAESNSEAYNARPEKLVMTVARCANGSVL